MEICFYIHEVIRMWSMVIVGFPKACGLHGGKGLGEPTMAPPAGAIGNAIYNALGVRVRSTPMMPEVIFRKIFYKRDRESWEG